MSGFKEQQQQNPVFKDCKVIFFWHHFLENSNSLRSTCSPHQLCYQRASQHPCSTAIFVILLWFMLYSVFSSKHCVKYFQERCKDSLGSYVVGIFFSFFETWRATILKDFFLWVFLFSKWEIVFLKKAPRLVTRDTVEQLFGTAIINGIYML